LSSIALLLVGLSAFVTGYLLYSRYIAQRIYRLDPDYTTPAHEFEDGVDFVPTNRHVLFGHHFTSVAGAAPIVGPAIAVIWGWLPAFIWVVVGTVFAGAVHDFGTLWLSVRHKGNSIGTLAESIIGGRARVLFLLIIFFLLLLVNAVFAVVIANLFMANPGAALPVWGSLLVAVVVGFLIYRAGAPILWTSLAALAILYGLIWLGQFAAFELPDLFGFNPTCGRRCGGGHASRSRGWGPRRMGDPVVRVWVLCQRAARVDPLAAQRLHQQPPALRRARDHLPGNPPHQPGCRRSGD
jgi:carbon starvation protein